MPLARSGFLRFIVCGCIAAAVLPVAAVRTSSDRPLTVNAPRLVHERTDELGDPSHVRQAYFATPMRFERNAARVGSGVDFITRGVGYTVYLASNAATLVMTEPNRDMKETGAQRRPARSVAIAIRLAGAKAGAEGRPYIELPGRTNHLIGANPRAWRSGMRAYARVEYRDVYRGVDVVYYGNQRQLEYDFVVAPGASYRDIALAVDGAKHVTIDQKGNLIIATDLGDVVQHAPIIYQQAKDGSRQRIEGGYMLRSGGQVGFRVERYDSRLPLVIDPVLSYSTYLGGGAEDFATGLAVDAQGNIYLAGETASLDFPQTTGQAAPVGGFDAFVAKLSPAGDSLVYATYLGGSGYEYATDLDVDLEGNAYVIGSTISRDFPTVRALRSSLSGYSDSFVTKLDATGAIVFSTYLGGKEEDYGYGIGVDGSGRAYVTGQTISPDFPTASPLQSTLGGSPAWKSVDGGDTFNAIESGLNTVWVKSLAIDPANTATLYAGTYSDGVFKSTDAGRTWSGNPAFPPAPVNALAVDPLNTSTVYAATDFAVFRSTDGGATWPDSALIGSRVTSLALDPMTPSTIYAGVEQNSYSSGGVFKSTDGGISWTETGLGETVFSLAISPSAPDTIYAGTSSRVFVSTTGGGGWTAPHVTLGMVQALAVDPGNPSIVYAGSDSGLFKSNSGGNDWMPVLPGAYVLSIVVAAGAPTRVYAGTIFGNVVSNDAGEIWQLMGGGAIIGWALAVDPVVATTVYMGTSVQWDAFVVRFSPDGSALEYSTYLGGTDFDYGRDVTVDSTGHAFIVGSTASSDYPLLTAAQTAFGGVRDLFVTKLSPSGGVAYSTYLGGGGWEDGGTIGVDASGQAHVAGYTLSQNFPLVNPHQSTFGGGFVDAFVTKLNQSGSAFVYSTYLGGNQSESGPQGHLVGQDPIVSIAVSPAGEAFVTGITASTNFPIESALQSVHGGGENDAFVAKFAADGVLRFSTFLGGNGADGGRRVALDPTGAAVVAGFTSSTNFPTRNPLQAVNAGPNDLFVARIVEEAPAGPTTTIGLSGTQGLGGWYRSDVTVTLTATDGAAGSGVAFVDYSINDGAFQRYTGPFTISGQGTSHVRARATDNAGTVESPTASAFVKIDTAVPVISVASPQAREYAHTEAVTLDFSASDAVSGLASGSPSATLDGAAIANGQSVQLLTLSLGAHTLAVTASDVAGNAAQRSVTFKVVATIQSLTGTVNIFASQGLIEANAQNSLLAKLAEAQEAIDRGNLNVARNKLRDFIDYVNARTGRTITADASQVLIADANHVLGTL
jgi:hypothetical protein